MRVRCSVECFVSTRTPSSSRNKFFLAFFSRRIEITSTVVGDRENLIVEVTNKVTLIIYRSKL